MYCVMAYQDMNHQLRYIEILWTIIEIFRHSCEEIGCFIFIWDLDRKYTRIWDFGGIYVNMKFSEFEISEFK